MSSTYREERTKYYARALKKLSILIDSELQAIERDSSKFEIDNRIAGSCHETIEAACILFGVIEQEET